MKGETNHLVSLSIIYYTYFHKITIWNLKLVKEDDNLKHFRLEYSLIFVLVKYHRSELNHCLKWLQLHLYYSHISSPSPSPIHYLQPLSIPQSGSHGLVDFYRRFLIDLKFNAYFSTINKSSKPGTRCLDTSRLSGFHDWERYLKA